MSQPIPTGVCTPPNHFAPVTICGPGRATSCHLKVISTSPVALRTSTESQAAATALAYQAAQQWAQSEFARIMAANRAAQGCIFQGTINVVTGVKYAGVP